jgi:hypothetical protein
MSSIAVALPILPGKTAEWQRFIGDLTTQRRAEVDAFHRRFGLTHANWYLNQTPGGAMAHVVLEVPEADGAFAQWAQSQDPFDVYFKSEVGQLYGLDLNQPPAGPAPQMVYEYRADNGHA